MSKEQFGEASKCRKNKQEEEKRKWKGISDVKLYTVNFLMANQDIIKEGAWRCPPPSIYFTQSKIFLKMSC